MLGVGPELVPLLAVGEAQSEGHLLLCPIDSGGLLQRRDFRILAFVRIDLKRKTVFFHYDQKVLIATELNLISSMVRQVLSCFITL